ncbi:MAG: hypothetical protein ACK55I_17840 [bacterium]
MPDPFPPLETPHDQEAPCGTLGRGQALQRGGNAPDDGAVPTVPRITDPHGDAHRAGGCDLGTRRRVCGV